MLSVLEGGEGRGRPGFEGELGTVEERVKMPACPLPNCHGGRVNFHKLRLTLEFWLLDQEL